jgi:hypothetical protein
MVLSQPGLIQGGSDAREQFLKMFAGEVLATFKTATQFVPLTRQRTIGSGKSAQFPAVHTAGANWHTAGESLITDTDVATNDYLSDIATQEKEIFIDDALVSSTFVDSLASMMNHWDERREYSREIGLALAKAADEHALAAILSASRASATFTGGKSGGKFTETGLGSDPSAVSGPQLVALAFQAAQKLDENDVPRMDRYIALRPEHYYDLVQQTNLLDRDFNSGSPGEFADGVVRKVAGFTIVPTNNMPTTDLSAVADSGAKNTLFLAGKGYNADWSATIGLCFHTSAAGTVKLAELSVGSEYQLERLGDLLVAKYAMGHGVLRPESSVELEAGA